MNAPLSQMGSRYVGSSYPTGTTRRPLKKLAADPRLLGTEEGVMC